MSDTREEKDMAAASSLVCCRTDYVGELKRWEYVCTRRKRGEKRGFVFVVAVLEGWTGAGGVSKAKLAISSRGFSRWSRPQACDLDSNGYIGVPNVPEFLYNLQNVSEGQICRELIRYTRRHQQKSVHTEVSPDYTPRQSDTVLTHSQGRFSVRSSMSLTSDVSSARFAAIFIFHDGRHMCILHQLPSNHLEE